MFPLFVLSRRASFYYLTIFNTGHKIVKNLDSRLRGNEGKEFSFAFLPAWGRCDYIMIQANPLLIAFVSIYVLQCLTDLWLERINLRHMEKCRGFIPETFEGFIDAVKLSSIRSYTLAKNRLAIYQGLLGEAMLLAYMLSGFMACLQESLVNRGLRFALAGCLFFLLPGFLLYTVSLPFDYYRTFLIEERFGFNRSTAALWATDHLKGVLLTVFMFGCILMVVLWLIRLSPNLWWFWAFIIVSLVQILLTVLYPKVIAPLFNKFEPVKDELLAASIRELMERNGFRVKNVFQMNAGLRSRHTNAYFTGLGKTKQIVLFDTLIEAHPHEEILAILAHEVGHFRRKHILKQLLLFEGVLLVGFYATSLLLDWPLLYSTFGVAGPQSYAGLFVIGVFWQKAGFFLQPVFAALSRRFEREADGFAVHLMEDPWSLATALKRTAADNLSNLSPHPLYVWFNYSHPPLVERIERLQKSNLHAQNVDGSLRSKEESK
jgi:STE24 endopeptidase